MVPMEKEGNLVGSIGWGHVCVSLDAGRASARIVVAHEGEEEWLAGRGRSWVELDDSMMSKHCHER